MAGLTVAQYAEHRGVSRQAVYKAVKGGRIKLGTDGRIDPYVADVAWERNTAAPPVAAAATREAPRRAPPPGRQPPPPVHRPVDHQLAAPHAGGGTVISLNDARARKEMAEAQLKELKLEQEMGRLVGVDQLRLVWFAKVRAVRDRLLGLIEHVAADLAAETSEHAVRVRLDRELRAALADLTAMPVGEGAFEDSPAGLE